MKLRNKICALALFLALSGCRLQQENPVVQEDKISPKVEEVKGKIDHLEQVVNTSSNSTQNQLGGLVNTSISKLAEKVTGVEAKVDRVVGFETSVGKITGLEAKLDKVVGFETRIDKIAGVEMKADKITGVESKIDRLTGLDAKIDKLEASLRVELKNSLEIAGRTENDIKALKATAGRDVNTDYFPKEAVAVMQNQNRMFIAIIGSLCALASTVISVFARNSRLRAEQRAKEEREERQQQFELLKRVLKL